MKARRSELNLESLGVAAGETHNPIDVLEASTRRNVQEPGRKEANPRVFSSRLPPDHQDAGRQRRAHR